MHFFLTIFTIALFTTTSIIVTTFFLSSSVSTISKDSAYLTYYSLSNLMSQAIKSGSATMTNKYMGPNYVIFTAYFDDDDEIPFYEFDGLDMNSVAVNLNDNKLFSQIVSSSTGRNYLNKGMDYRQELEKCVGEPCLCIGEVETGVLLDRDYLVPNSCVDICWGEYPQEYQQCAATTYGTPREIMSQCNNEISNSHQDSLCHKCVSYMNRYDSLFKVVREGNINILVLRRPMADGAKEGNVGTQYGSISTNEEDAEALMEMSNAMKFSFLKNVLSCTPMSEIGSSSGKSQYCNPTTNSPYLLYYDNLGLVTMMSTSYLSDDGKIEMPVILIKLVDARYSADDIFEPDRCIVKISSIDGEEG